MSNVLNIGNGLGAINLGTTSQAIVLGYNIGYVPTVSTTVYGPLFSTAYPTNFELTDSAPMAANVGGGLNFAGNDGNIPNRTFAMIQ